MSYFGYEILPHHIFEVQFINLYNYQYGCWVCHRFKPWVQWSIHVWEIWKWVFFIPGGASIHHAVKQNSSLSFRNQSYCQIQCDFSWIEPITSSVWVLSVCIFTITLHEKMFLLKPPVIYMASRVWICERPPKRVYLMILIAFLPYFLISDTLLQRKLKTASAGLLLLNQRTGQW